MKVSFFRMIAGLVLLPLLSATEETGTELLKNRAFQDGFTAWTVPGAAGTFEAKADCLEVHAPQDGKHFLIQYGLPTGAGEYIFSGEIQGEPGGSYSAYAEWAVRKADNSEQYGSSGSSAIQANGQWQRFERVITVTPEQSRAMTALYVAFYFDGQKHYQVRNLSFVKVPEAAPPSAELTEVIKNGDFRRGLFRWTANVPDGIFSVKDGVFQADLKDNATRFLIQYDLPLSQGDYTLTYEICAADGSQFLGYAEWNLDVGGNVVYGSSGSAAQPGTGSWQKIERKFSVADSVAADMTALYVAFGLIGPGKIQLRNVSLTRIGGAPKPVAPAPLKMLGGVWHFSGGSSVKTGEEPVLELINASTLKNIPVKAGQYYRLSFRTKGVISPDITNYCIFRTDLLFSNNSAEQPPVIDDTNLGWLQNKSLEFQVPANSDKLDLKITVKSGARICFDRFLLEAIPAPVDKGELTLSEPAYRNRIYASMPCNTLAGKLRLPEGAKNAAVELCKGETVLDKAQLNADGTFSFAKVPAAGKYRLCAKFTGKDGKAAENFLPAEVAPAQNDAMEAVMDAGHNFRFNGMPFFPIAFWSTGLFSDVGYYYAARQGVNLIVFGGDDGTPDEATALTMLNSLARFKMKIFFTTGMIRGTDEAARQEFRIGLERVFTKRVRNHPAFFGYFTSDEPIWRGEPQAKVMAMYEILREFDPNHPVWINSAPRNSLKEHRHYAQAADIYGVDIYPVPTPGEHSGLEDKELTCVGKYADFCRQAVNGRRAVWMCMQGFSWHTMYQGEDGSGYPTLPELRFMAYDSFLQGSNGATYWGPHHIKNQQFSNDLFAMTRELRDRSALFAATEKLVPCQTGSPLLAASQVTVDNVTFVVAVNRSKTPLSAHVTGDFPELTSLEDGQTQLSSGGTVSLPGYGAAVFASGKMPAPLNELCPEIAELERLGNPYAKRIARSTVTNPTVPYSGNAGWIWDDRELKARGKSDLEKCFTLNEPVKAAVLHIAVDNIADASLNGQPADEFDAWNLMRNIDVTKLLVQGENRLKVHAENDFYLPCGLLVDLEITLASGAVKHIVSDESWLTSDGKPATVVARYGENAWGKRVAVEK